VVRVLPNDSARSALRLTKSKARSFYLASLFMPSSVRADVHSLYAFYRTVDDLVDEPFDACSRQGRLDTLLTWEDALRGGQPADNGFVGGAIGLADRYNIPIDYLCLVLEGARFDLEMRTIETKQELIHYSVLMAGSVGMVMSYILGARDSESLSAASDLGVAMQITNVLRDVGEDLTRGRIYLPLDELQKYGCAIGDLKRGRVNEPFCGVMQSLALLAREYYDSGMQGIPRLDRSSQFSIYLAATLYRRILDKIEEQGFNVFGRRAGLGAAEKWMMTMPTYLAHRQVGRRQS
jgi:15-cis-phytoene synthase